jgi:hypothetical protein
MANKIFRELYVIEFSYPNQKIIIRINHVIVTHFASGFRIS